VNTVERKTGTAYADEQRQREREREMETVVSTRHRTNGTRSLARSFVGP